MKKALLLIGILALPFLAHSQVVKYKAVFTINFIRYIGWTEAAKEGDFVIGVVKNKEIAEWLQNLSKGKRFGFQNVVIKEFKSPAEVSPCQALYIPSNINLSKHASTIISNLGNKTTLIITEKEGATKHGSMLNFVIRDDKLKFEIHKANANKAGLKISSKLETMASAISL